MYAKPPATLKKEVSVDGKLMHLTGLEPASRETCGPKPHAYAYFATGATIKRSKTCKKI